MLLDAAIWLVAIYGAARLRVDVKDNLLLGAATLAFAVALVLGAINDPHVADHRHGSFEEVTDLLGTILVAGIGLLTWTFFAAPLVFVRSVPVVAGAMALAGMLSARFLIHGWHSRPSVSGSDGQQVDRASEQKSEATALSVAQPPNNTDFTHSGDRLGDPPLLMRKSVLMLMLTSGFVIANTPTTAGTAKPAPIAAAQRAHTPDETLRPNAPGMLARDNDVVGDGITDDGAALNALLVSAATLEVPVVLTKRSTIYTTVEIMIPSNTVLKGNGATIKCGIPGTYTPTVGIKNVSNVIVESLNINGNKSAFSGVFTEFKHGIQMVTATNVILQNVSTNMNKGDGIEIAGDNTGSYCEHITLNNVTCEHNHRNGLSVESAIAVRVHDGSYSYSSGTSPQCGIDIEPNSAADVIQDVSFDGSVATGNANAGLSVRLSAAPMSNQEGIQLTSCVLSSNAGPGVQLSIANHITFTDCAINNNGYAGISTVTTVNHLSISGGEILRNKTRGIFGTTTTMNDWLISGVKILDNVGYGLSLDGTGSGFVITSNTIGNKTTSNQLYGVATAVPTLTHVSILNNDVRGNTIYGMGLADDTATRLAQSNKGYNSQG